MGSRKKKSQRLQLKPSGLVGSRSEIELDFRESVKSVCCPGCGLEFTDFAVDWGHAWSEGHADGLFETGVQQRGNPDMKLKCELCGHRSWLNTIAMSVSSAEEEAD